MKQILLFSAFLAVAQNAAAGTIIWDAFGTVTSLTYASFLGGGSTPPPGWTRLGPPAGTPYSLQLSFDPTDLRPTPQAPLPNNPECSYTPVQAILSLGSFTYTASGGAFTNALFPASNCETDGRFREPGSTEFFLTRPVSTDPDAWRLDEGANFLSAIYYDTIHQHGTIATIPMMDRTGSLYFQNEFFNFRGPFAPAAIEQPAAVPEPGTMLLLGTGLALAARRRFRR